MKCLLVLIVSALLPAAGAWAETLPSVENAAAKLGQEVRRNEALIRELGGMGAIDHLIRARFLSLRKGATEAERAALDDVWRRDYEPLDLANERRLKALLQGRAWFTRDEVGEEAEGAAFSVVSHSSDLAFQKAVLAKMEQLPDLAAVTGYANLYDRVAVQDGRPQRYATQQPACVDGEYALPEKLEDPANLDLRRRALNLPSMASAFATLKQMYGPCSAPPAAVASRP